MKPIFIVTLCRSKWSPWYLHPKEDKTIQIVEAMWHRRILFSPDFHGHKTPLVAHYLILAQMYYVYLILAFPLKQIKSPPL